MPIFDDDNMDSFKATGSGFQFSGVSFDNIQAMEQTLVGILADQSSSVSGFAPEIEGCLKSSLDGCQKSPRVDNLLVRTLTFNHKIEELHGFRPLADCHLNNYNGCIKPSGTTSLYDATVNMVDSMATYGTGLTSRDFTANGIIVILTDGMDVGSSFGVNTVREALARARKSEALESILTILIGINVQDKEVSKFLQAFKDEAGIDQYVEAKDASAKTFAKIAGFISNSVSSQSQALKTGSASVPITF